LYPLTRPASWTTIPSLIIVLLVNHRFTDPVLTGGQTVAKIEHIQELRDGVK